MKKVFLIFLVNLSLFASSYDEAMKLYDDRKYKEALQILIPLADAGDPKAQNDVGIMYETGQGITANFKVASKYYGDSAEQGYAEGECNFGLIKKAQKKYHEAVQLFQKSANQGNMCGEHYLAVMYQHGKGIKRDYSKALEYYKKSADKGYILAQSNLAVMYEKGKGTKINLSEAIRYYELSADGGDYIAQYNLGMIYYMGKSTTQDLVKAKELFKKACDNDHYLGCENYKLLNK